MKITVIGTGYVGLVSGTCFAEMGFQVQCVDKDSLKIEKLQKGIIPIFEPGLDDLVMQNLSKQRLSFTTNIQEALCDAQIVFIAVGTPTRRGDGHADLTYVFEAVSEVAANVTNNIILVTKSTVPVGTGRKIQALVDKIKPAYNIAVASNPEFLREGSAINDFMKPDRVILGVQSQENAEILQQLYLPICQNEVPLVVTTLESAEMIKYAANAFLATKITFINEMANLCEVTGADVQQVSQGIGLDKRIGKDFLQAGPGYGGSCFPKDTLALLQTSHAYGIDLSIVESVVKSNDVRKLAMVDLIKKSLNNNVAEKKIAVLGVTFKPNTDDMRDSPSLTIIPKLQDLGAQIHVCDPQGFKEGQYCLQNITWCENPYVAAQGADALVIMTEWNEFRALDLKKLKTIMNNPLMVDLRNVYNNTVASQAGLSYVSLGRPSVFRKKSHLIVTNA